MTLQCALVVRQIFSRAHSNTTLSLINVIKKSKVEKDWKIRRNSLVQASEETFICLIGFKTFENKLKHFYVTSKVIFLHSGPYLRKVLHYLLTPWHPENGLKWLISTTFTLRVCKEFFKTKLYYKQTHFCNLKHFMIIEHLPWFMDNLQEITDVLQKGL